MMMIIIVQLTEWFSYRLLLLAYERDKVKKHDEL